MTCAGLLLAAGSGSRFGRPKALVEVDGRLLVERGVDVLTSAGCEPVVVVLGAAAHDVIARARLDAALVVVNEGWAEGIGSSLRAGLNVLTDLDAQQVVVLLADQPRVTPAVVRRLVGAGTSAPAVVASYAGRPGNPALLDRSVWSSVSRLALGDVGARAWMRQHPEQVRVVACDDLGSDVDIDIPDDLTRLSGGADMEHNA
jgi:CTP:molybdopterin cytidylyltransferase MocA